MSKELKDLSTEEVIAVVIIVILLAVMMPFAFIWAINTLFATGLAYSFWNWLAMVIFTSFVGGIFGAGRTK